MMMTKFPTICLTILFCISAGICAAQSKDTTQNYEEIVNER